MKPALAIAAASTALLAVAAPAHAMSLGQHRVAEAAAPSAAASTSLIAPLSACPNQLDHDATAPLQEAAMRCMTDWARTRAGLEPLVAAEQLDSSAGRKVGDILRCDEFSHFACGREFTYWMEEAGYLSGCWRAGENLAWGTGNRGTVRSIFRAWMASPSHRHNILEDFSQLGVSLAVGELDGLTAVHVWAQHFGAHCE